MIKKLFKFIRNILVLLILFAILFICYLFYSGYTMYKEEIDKVSISDRVAQIEATTNYTKIEDMPQIYKDAVVAIEDHRFYEHHGIDPISTFRAFFVNIQEGGLEQGGSTITQQLAKNMYFSQEKKFTRKIAELFVALDLEKNYDKNKILELYINTMYFGKGYYGIKEASNGYFDKEPIDLSDYEATYIAGIPNAPSIFSSSKHSDLAIKRHKLVLDAMVKYNKISQETANQIYNSNENIE